jgi:hypothetical protein
MMNTKVLLHLCAVVVALSVLLGCQGLDKNLNKALGEISVQRTVENNVFSSTFPEVKLRINPELEYLGDAQFSQSTDKQTRMQNLNENIFSEHSYLFGQLDENRRLLKGVLIRTMVMRGDPNQAVNEQFFTMENPLDSGNMKILDEDYKYDLYTQQNLFTDEEKTLLSQSSIPPCILVKKLESKAGIGNKARLQIAYFEDISNTKGLACKEALSARDLTGEQRQFVQAFTDRSYQSVRFLKTKVDTTSKYVDSDAKDTEAVKAPAPQDTGASKVQTIENRLKTLKDLHDKNLITNEEYEMKRAKILKEL